MIPRFLKGVEAATDLNGLVEPTEKLVREVRTLTGQSYEEELL